MKMAEKHIFEGDSDIESCLPIPESEIKFYPGSIKGLAPEDDPVAYSKWFVENQPASLKDSHGNPAIDMLGVKKKFLRMVKDDAS